MSAELCPRCQQPSNNGQHEPNAFFNMTICEALAADAIKIANAAQQDYRDGLIADRLSR